MIRTILARVSCVKNFRIKQKFVRKISKNSIETHKTQNFGSELGGGRLVALASCTNIGKQGQAPEPTLDQTLTPRPKRSNKSTRTTQPMSADHQRHLPPPKENF